MDATKNIIRRFVEELWNARKLEVADEIFSEECVTHQLHSGDDADPVRRGPDEMKEHISNWVLSFPDLHFTVEQMIGDGDRVVSQLRMEGTHQGTWMGISPTGRRLQIRMVTIHRIADRKIVEDWVLVESLGFFQQLGVLPKPEVLIRSFTQQVNSWSR